MSDGLLFFVAFQEVSLLKQEYNNNNLYKNSVTKSKRDVKICIEKGFILPLTMLYILYLKKVKINRREIVSGVWVVSIVSISYSS
ncbi:hypothetical protein PPSC2_28445 (plasmid) [Paenibacillus polymyxa SC2]|uniref:Uncharacterized protein n=1 Tax=Paenibacillus polymyxa (strain SC2) TaxID=886882 RepID=A0A0D5ZCV2_PAEPS|nr:hypothetical protein PPSC2_28445 [Paenibacillus polymyxa SC2]